MDIALEVQVYRRSTMLSRLVVSLGPLYCNALLFEYCSDYTQLSVMIEKDELTICFQEHTGAAFAGRFLRRTQLRLSHFLENVTQLNCMNRRSGISRIREPLD